MIHFDHLVSLNPILAVNHGESILTTNQNTKSQKKRLTAINLILICFIVFDLPCPKRYTTDKHSYGGAPQSMPRPVKSMFLGLWIIGIACLFLYAGSGLVDASSKTAIVRLDIPSATSEESEEPCYLSMQWNFSRDTWAVHGSISIDDALLLLLVGTNQDGHREFGHQVVVITPSNADEFHEIKSRCGNVYETLQVKRDENNDSIVIITKDLKTRRIQAGDLLVLNHPQMRIKYHGLVPHNEILAFDIID